MKNQSLILSALNLLIFGFIFFPVAAKAQIADARFSASGGSRSKPLNTAALERRVFELVNQTREENGLKRLVWNEQVARVARLHSGNMANFNFFSHTGLDGKRVDARADAVGLRKWALIGENIAYNSGFDNPVERAILGWMNSAGHRQNILRDKWKETGIGIAVSPSGRFYITQVFLKRN